MIKNYMISGTGEVFKSKDEAFKKMLHYTEGAFFDRVFDRKDEKHISSEILYLNENGFIEITETLCFELVDERYIWCESMLKSHNNSCEEDKGVEVDADSIEDEKERNEKIYNLKVKYAGYYLIKRLMDEVGICNEELALDMYKIRVQLKEMITIDDYRILRKKLIARSNDIILMYLDCLDEI